MKRALVIWFALLVLGALTVSAQGADPIIVTSNTFTNNFRQNLKFELQAESSAGQINQIALFIQIDGISSSTRQLPEFTPGKQVQATYEWRLTTNYLPPGVTGQFWWAIEDNAGSKIMTDKQSFRVDDAGKPWKQLSNDRFALYWYIGSDAFGKALFDRGVQAMEYLQQDIGITVDRQIQTFIYGNRSDFRNALAVGSQEWTGAQAFSDYSIILIGVEPANLEWGKSATTHELTHQVIAQKIRSPLGDLSMPHWVNEGMAMYYETYPGTLDSQFRTPLNRAIQNDTMPPLRTLSGSFPADSAAANLAYAQSYSVVDFIYSQYGKEKMAALLQDFKKGGDDDDIFPRVLGLGIDELDNEWRKHVGLKPRAIPTRVSNKPTPFPTFSLSTDDSTPSVTTPVTPVPTPEATFPPTPTPTALPTAPTATSVVFVDDFETNRHLQVIDDAERTFAYEAGEYFMLAKKGGYILRTGYSTIYDDAVISVDARAPTPDTRVEYGIAFRVSAEPRYYLFAVNTSGGYGLYYYSSFTKLLELIGYTESPAIKPGTEKNRLMVVMQGKEIALYVNDQHLDTISDPALAQGTVALVMISANDNAKAIFDNLTISKIDPLPTVTPVREQTLVP